MRIAVINAYARAVGGVERYLGTVLGPIADRGHDVALFAEHEGPAGHDEIELPAGAPRFVGAHELIEEVSRWTPDVLYIHGNIDVALEARLVVSAPCVRFLHDYNGACISGAKTFLLPRVEPCSRAFGAACLFHYFPRRCGGLNPVTMIDLYRSGKRRNNLLNEYRRLLVASEYMRGVMVQNGVDGDLIVTTRLPIVPATSELSEVDSRDSTRARICFVGRMEALKGAGVLLSALVQVVRDVGEVEAVFIGDGAQRQELEDMASVLHESTPGLSIRFTGWLKPRAIESELAGADLLVIPSLWPEPFGMVGIEAGFLGVPSVAFAAGGIPEWLEDGVNGYLADSDPPSATSLAAAIRRALGTGEERSRLRDAARRSAARYTVDGHVTQLLSVLDDATRG